MNPPNDEYIDQEGPIYIDGDELQKKSIKLAPDPDPDPPYSPTQTSQDHSVECLGFDPIPALSSAKPGSELTGRREATDHPAMPEAGVTVIAHDLHHAIAKVSHEGMKTASVADLATASSPDDLQKTAASAIRVAEKGTPEDVKELAERPVHRVDSAQESSESVPQLTAERRSHRSGRASPLRVQTDAPLPKDPAALEDSLTRSPTLAKHIIQVEDKVLPRVQGTSPITETSATSSRKESLPSFRQLADLADVAAQHAQQDVRPPAQHSHQHSHSFSSTASQSPMIPYHPAYTNSAQTSPVSYGMARSPTSTIGGEGFTYGSPSQNPGSAYYFTDRRISNAHDSAHTYPTPVPSLPSNPSSGESQVGNAGSSTDGYSTSHTTPIDPGSVPPDGMHRPVPILPPPPGMPPGMAIVPAGGFTCDYPGCNAMPFQTQYLLSSHRNVHSQSRPHYCPVKECPRSEGGKGFKRKNEMIRHGLVHNSPGYICPFCPDREHKYPRPDNLQRHVRVHHVDKDRDDPALREVLAQRSEGTVQKQRRRRTQGSGSSSRENQVSESAP